jgi:hypothetical protein
MPPPPLRFCLCRYCAATKLPPPLPPLPPLLLFLLLSSLLPPPPPCYCRASTVTATQPPTLWRGAAG